MLRCFIGITAGTEINYWLTHVLCFKSGHWAQHNARPTGVLPRIHPPPILPISCLWIIYQKRPNRLYLGYQIRVSYICILIGRFWLPHWFCCLWPRTVVCSSSMPSLLIPQSPVTQACTIAAWLWGPLYLWPSAVQTSIYQTCHIGSQWWPGQIGEVWAVLYRYGVSRR